MSGRFRFLMIGLFFLAFIFGSATTDRTPAADKKPNILFIITDDQRYNTIHELGGEQVITPNLDKLVKGGTSFTHAYNMGAWQGAVCVASRSMLVSGMSVWDVRQEEKDFSKLASQNGFWPQHLKKAGYETYMAGKWHVNQNPEQIFDHVKHVRPGMANQTSEGYNRPLSRSDTTWAAWKTAYGGFWEGGDHWSKVLADDAIEYLAAASSKEAPFFMYLAFNSPHDPRQAPKRWVDQYDADKISLPKSFMEEYPYAEAMGSGRSLRDEKLAPFPRTPYAVKKHIQEYYASISYTDEQIGRILGALAGSGKLENTYVFFTSDHGLSIGHHGLMGKQSMFDDAIRAPLVVSGPGIPKAERRSQDVYLQDIAATTLELAGAPGSEKQYFHSLLPLIRNANEKSRYESIYGCYINTQRMVRSDGYKMIVYPAIKKVLLFDLKKDPEELHDIAGQPGSKSVLRELKAKFLKQQKELHDGLDLTEILASID